MFSVLHQRIDRILATADAGVLRRGLRGVEKESLRVGQDGRISRLPHPQALGSALTHPWVTTDFSEALPELVTPPFQDNWETLSFLCDLHQFVIRNIGDEMLWATSMPCAVEDEESVPIATFGRSNAGRMKEVYRRGLSYRYGRVMQAIAGVHFNYSVPDALWPVLERIYGHDGESRQLRDRLYFDLLRNYRRLGWLILYLFGASPAVCKSFFLGRESGLPDLDPITAYGPYATTLRMSGVGYRNSNQAGICLSMNALDEYLAGLDRAIHTPFAAYEHIGTQVDGEWRQLSTSMLQIENEYYGFIRPKQVARSGERPAGALRRRGVSYVEVRALDVSPFDPAGINQNEMRFLEAFLLMCMLMDSPPMSGEEAARCDRNHVEVAQHGRDPDLGLDGGGRSRGVSEWGLGIVDAMVPICELLDADGDGSYAAALELQREKIIDPRRTPSARILEDMRSSGESFFDFATRLSRDHREYFLQLPELKGERADQFDGEALASLDRQRYIEAADDISFEAFLARYFASA
ncbi:MAG: glutamate--cysteine ligase [Gammaproteobacteria bacterium]|jgi:glutamate--cysteine ligase